MGNIFVKPLKCDKCNNAKIKPKYFTKHISNNPSSILIDRFTLYDKWGNVINEDKLEYHYICSNGHKIDNT